MAELTAGYRWAWSFSGQRPTAGDIQGAINAYVRRHNGRFPSILFVNPVHLVEGIQPPLGLVVEGDRNMNRAILEFAVPEDEAPAVEVDQAPGLFALVFPVAFPALAQLGNGPGAPLPLNGLSLVGLFLVGLAMAIAFSRLIAALRGGQGGDPMA